MKLNLKSLALCAAMLIFGFAENNVPYYLYGTHDIGRNNNRSIYSEIYAISQGRYTNVTNDQLKNLDLRIEPRLSGGYHIEGTYGKFELTGYFDGSISYYLIDHNIRDNHNEILSLYTNYIDCSRTDIRREDQSKHLLDYYPISYYPDRHAIGSPHREDTMNILNSYQVTEGELVTLSREILRRVNEFIFRNNQ